MNGLIDTLLGGLTLQLELIPGKPNVHGAGYDDLIGVRMGTGDVERYQGRSYRAARANETPGPLFPEVQNIHGWYGFVECDTSQLAKLYDIQKDSAEALLYGNMTSPGHSLLEALYLRKGYVTAVRIGMARTRCENLEQAVRLSQATQKDAMPNLYWLYRDAKGLLMRDAEVTALLRPR